MNLKDKIVVITGGGRGLGKAMAEVFMQRKAQVIVCDIGDAATSTSVADSLGTPAILDNNVHITQKQEGLLEHVADVTKETDLQCVADDAFLKFGKIDIWINNAGIWMPKENLELVNIEKAKKLFKVNVMGTMNGMRSALKHMKPQKSGVIVNIISTTAFDGMDGSSGSMYVASKYALRGLTNTVRDELKDTGVQLIGAYPGGMQTDIFSEQPPKNLGEFMSPDEVAVKIIENLELDKPETELILKRAGQAAGNLVDKII
jgi:NAD(P)-dependent dehydrogenase (short-subunit alcohol dehydrogenase family)